MDARIPKKYENGVCFDWFEFTVFSIDNVYHIVKLLGLDQYDWSEAYGQYGYGSGIQFQKIFVLFDGRPDMGIHIRMSGQGCRAFEKYSTKSFKQLSSELVALGDGASMSRVDIAYDDFNGLIDLNAIIDDVRAGNVVSRFRKGTIIEGFHLGGAVTHPDTTLNIGRQGSNIWITLYDKMAERRSKDIIPDCDCWTRCEIKLRKENANRLIQLFSENKPLPELYFLVLNNYLRIVQPNGEDRNRWRWPLAEHWERFCNSLINDSISLYVAPTENYDEYKLQHYVTGMAGAAVYTYIQRFGIKDLMERVDLKKYTLAIKYRELLSDPEEDNKSDEPF